MHQPRNPKIYHIIHLDRLPSIIQDGFLLSDRIISQRKNIGSIIGMNHIKQRRLNELTLSSYPDLFVGDCVPFYFCPRSVMLYLIYSGRSGEVAYKGGQLPIVHLVADLNAVVAWANENLQRWVFTASNAGSYYFEDTNDIANLNKLRWDSIITNQWAGEHKEGKQAEFLLENRFPWHLVESIGVINTQAQADVIKLIASASYQPSIAVQNNWYY